MKVPEPTPTPSPEPKKKRASPPGQNCKCQHQYYNCCSPDHKHRTECSCFFCSRIFQRWNGSGSYVNITYTGNFNGESTSGMKIRGITGEDPDTLSVRNISSTVTGTILGTTANTVLIQTYDGVKILCDRENAQDLSTSGMEEGADSGLLLTLRNSAPPIFIPVLNSKTRDGRRTEFFFPRLPSSFVPPVYHPVCQKKLCFRPAHLVREEPGMHRHHFPLPHGSFSQKLSSDSAHLS